VAVCVGHWLVAVSVGAGVGDISVVHASAGVGIGDVDELVGVGVGELVGEATGQVRTSVLVSYGGTDVVGLAVGGEETSVADAVPDASATSSVGLGLAPGKTGVAVGPHPAVDVGRGAAVFEFPAAVAVLPWLACPPPDAAPSTDGVLPPPLARVPLPSVPAPRPVPVLRCGGPLPPCSAVLAWRIAWRSG
jgi:hypothetical protein